MWRFIRHHSVIFGYLIIILLVFGRALVPPEGQIIFGDDIHHQYYFYRQFFNEWIGKGIFPWWNPYLFGGEPFIANPVVNIWYPPNWLFSVLPLNIAFSWHLALHIFWAMLGMYWLLRSLSIKYHVSGISAWVGGVIFGLSGFFAARIFAGHVDVIAAASWMPWVVYAFTRKKFAVATITFALQLLAGYQTMAFFTAIVVAVFTWRRPFRAFAAGLAGVGLAAFHIVPVSEFFQRTIRTYSLPYAWNSDGALTWESLKQLVLPFYFGNQHTYTGPPPNFVEHAMFIGISGFVLMLIGALNPRGWRRLTPGVVFIVLALFGLWMSLGPNAPLDLQYILWKIVPMYHALRIPSRHLLLFSFGAAGLAAMGLGVFHKTAQKLIAVVVVAELVLFARSFIELRPLPETGHDTEVVSLLTPGVEPYRVLQNFGVWLPQRDVLNFDSVMSYGIFSATGYDPSILKNYYEYVARASGTTGEKAVLEQDVQVPYLTPQAGDQMDFLNIKYILVPPAYDPFIGNDRYRLLRENDYRLYENTTVLPRFYLSDRPCGEATIASYTPNRVELAVNSSCDTQLVSSEVYYPGWEAYADGKRTDITVSNNAFRTLFLPAGNHHIVFQYRPTIFVIGVIISGLTIATLLIFRRANRQ